MIFEILLKFLECKDTEASYACVCSEGYAFGEYGAACIDNNECLLGTHNCHPDALCANHGGGFYCYCKVRISRISPTLLRRSYTVYQNGDKTVRKFSCRPYF